MRHGASLRSQPRSDGMGLDLHPHPVDAVQCHRPGHWLAASERTLQTAERHRPRHEPSTPAMTCPDSAQCLSAIVTHRRRLTAWRRHDLGVGCRRARAWRLHRMSGQNSQPAARAGSRCRAVDRGTGVLAGHRIGGIDNWWAALGSNPEPDSALRPSDWEKPIPIGASRRGHLP